MKRFAAVILSISIVCLYTGCGKAPPSSRVASHEIDIFSDPVQNNHAPSVVEQREFDGFKWKITAVTGYILRGKVRSVQKYSSGWQSKFSPVDFCVTWGKLNSPQVEPYISYSQRNRWYFYRYKPGTPVDNDYIIRNSCNAHIIPADDLIRKAVLLVREGDIIDARGYLANVRGDHPDGRYFYWNTSLSRSDTGDGSCEVFYVTSIQIGNNVYESESR